MKTVVLVDGGYFIKRYRTLYADARHHSPVKVVRNLYGGILRDIRSCNKKTLDRDLYRILYYDCPPLVKRGVHHPISGKSIDFSQTPEAQFRLELHKQLKRQRKVALRLGHLGTSSHWLITPGKTKQLLKGEISIQGLSESDVNYDVRQKGVDMKIGLDIASLAYKRSVDQIILIAGDADFVPAAKLARREGIDFVLDPMWNPIDPNLHEHIDGLVSKWPHPEQRKKSGNSIHRSTVAPAGDGKVA